MRAVTSTATRATTMAEGLADSNVEGASVGVVDMVAVAEGVAVLALEDAEVDSSVRAVDGGSLDVVVMAVDSLVEEDASDADAVMGTVVEEDVARALGVVPDVSIVSGASVVGVSVGDALVVVAAMVAAVAEDAARASGVVADVSIVSTASVIADTRTIISLVRTSCADHV